MYERDPKMLECGKLLTNTSIPRVKTNRYPTNWLGGKVNSDMTKFWMTWNLFDKIIYKKLIYTIYWTKNLGNIW